MLWKHNFRRYNFFTMSFHSFFLLEQKESVQMHLNKIHFNERKRKMCVIGFGRRGKGYLG